MGNQVPLDALRNKRYKSIWCAKNGKEALKLVQRDYVIRHNIEKYCREKGCDHVRTIITGGLNDLNIDLYSLKPAFLLGKGKGSVSSLSKKIEKSSIWYKIDPIKNCNMSVLAVQNPELDAESIALKIGTDLERGRSFNMAMKMNIQSAMNSGAIGVMIKCSGRLNGNEIARSETRKMGKVPRKTIRANTFYACHHAYTKSGSCGIQVRVNVPKDLQIKANNSGSNNYKNRRFGPKDSVKSFNKKEVSSQPPSGSQEVSA